MRYYTAFTVTREKDPEVMISAVSTVSIGDAVDRLKVIFVDSFAENGAEHWQDVLGGTDGDYRLLTSVYED